MFIYSCVFVRVCACVPACLPARLRVRVRARPRMYVRIGVSEWVGIAHLDAPVEPVAVYERPKRRRRRARIVVACVAGCCF